MVKSALLIYVYFDMYYFQIYLMTTSCKCLFWPKISCYYRGTVFYYESQSECGGSVLGLLIRICIRPKPTERVKFMCIGHHYQASTQVLATIE